MKSFVTSNKSNTQSSSKSFFNKSEQSSFFSPSNATHAPFSGNTLQRKQNRTGMPDTLKTGLEQLSNFDMSGVRVHKNSSYPAQVNALAFTQGQDIYLGPGQEKHLPHEGWHVTQQMQGRVKPTMQAKGLPVNNDAALEEEADVMGRKALQVKGKERALTGPDLPVAENTHTPFTAQFASAGPTSLSNTLQQILSPQPTTTRPVLQFTLTDDLRRLMDIYGPVHYEGVVQAIRSAPVAERRVAVANATILNLIRTRIGSTYGSAVISELLVGSQNWENPPATDFYTHFVLNSGQGTIPNTQTMNCWESIMYAAHLSGQLSAAWIRNYYVQAGALPGTTVDPTPRLWAQLNFSTALPQYSPTGAQQPSMGQLIFYVNTGSSIPAHVAVYVGNGEVISLWTQPNSIRSIQRIPIGSISGTIYYGNPPW